MKKYHSVTAHINQDGSPMIAAWYKEGRSLRFDTIPLRGSTGGIVRKIISVELEEVK